MTYTWWYVAVLGPTFILVGILFFALGIFRRPPRKALALFHLLALSLHLYTWEYAWQDLHGQSRQAVEEFTTYPLRSGVITTYIRCPGPGCPPPPDFWTICAAQAKYATRHAPIELWDVEALQGAFQCF